MKRGLFSLTVGGAMLATISLLPAQPASDEPREPFKLGTFQIEGRTFGSLTDAPTSPHRNLPFLFWQKLQAHIRPGNQKEPIFYGKEVEEWGTYRFEGEQLMVTFPSHNRYVLERVK